MTSFRSKVNLRGFGKLFRNLAPAVRAKIEAAFKEAEVMLDYGNRSWIDKQTRRIPSALITSPVIAVATSPQGIQVIWNKLEDRRVSMYEVEYDDTQIFSAPSSKTIVDTFYELDGVSLDVELFFRVRAVWFDGQTGPWSNTASGTPTATSPVAAYSFDKDDLDITTYSDPGIAGDVADWQYLGEHRVTGAAKTTGGAIFWGSYSEQLDVSTTQLAYHHRILAQGGIDNGTNIDMHLVDQDNYDGRGVGKYVTGQRYGLNIREPSQTTCDNGGVTYSWGPVFIARPFQEITHSTRTSYLTANSPAIYTGNWFNNWSGAPKMDSGIENIAQGVVETSDAAYFYNWGHTLPGAAPGTHRIVGCKIKVAMWITQGIYDYIRIAKIGVIDSNGNIAMSGNVFENYAEDWQDNGLTYTVGHRNDLLGGSGSDGFDVSLMTGAAAGVFVTCAAYKAGGAGSLRVQVSVPEFTLYYTRATNDMTVVYEMLMPNAAESDRTVLNATTNIIDVGNE